MTNKTDSARLKESIPDPDRRITIKAARKMLGMVGRNYSDEDIEQVLDILYGMAEVAYEGFQKNDFQGD